MELRFRRLLLGATALLSALFADNAHAGPDFLEGTRETRPPMGYLQFCNDNPAECRSTALRPAAVELTPARLAELVEVNRRVNGHIRPVTDRELWNVMERWTFPVDGMGDCEEYVLMKRQILMDSGWPEQTLLITVVLDTRGDGHAVLAARTSRGDLILDNQDPEVRLWSQTGYRFVKRQADWNPTQWVGISGPQNLVHTASGN